MTGLRYSHPLGNLPLVVSVELNEVFLHVDSSVKIFTTNLLGLSLSNSPSSSAQLCHPDLNPSDESLHKKFLAVQEAYDVLSCDVKKREYDFDNVPSRPRPTV